MGVFALMVVPGSFDVQTDEFAFYGAGHMVVKDAFGNITLEQTIHNQLVDTGEEYILDAVFEDGATAVVDDAQIGLICISDDNDNTGGTTIGVIDDSDTAATFDASDTYTAGSPCIEVAANGVTTASGVGTVGPLTFTAGTHLEAGGLVALVGICQKDGDTVHDELLAACGIGGGGGILFAIFNPTDVTLATSETAQIEYKFDISASGT